MKPIFLLYGDKTMKKLFAIALLTLSLGSSAFFNGNNGPWGGNGWGNNGWNNGWNDNGIFGYNSYDYWDPRWYMEEMENMMDEFDDNGWNDNYYGSGPYGNPYNNFRSGPYNNFRNGPYNNFNRGPWGPAAPVAPAAPAPAK